MSSDFLAACRILDGEGLTTCFGHLSVRDGDGAIVSAIEGPGLVASMDDTVRTTLDEAPPRTPGEAAIHLGIYRARPDVQAVCRFHGPACLAWGTLDRPLPAATGMGLLMNQGDSPLDSPVHDTSTTIRDAAAADALAATLGDGGSVILRGFGAVTVGVSIAEAVARAWLLERNAAAVLAASAAGEPQPYDDAPPVSAAVADSQIARVFHYLKEKHP